MHIRLSELTMKFKDVTAVDRLSIDIEEGKLVSLLGPSGCGKSTTLFTIAGLYNPTEGKIFFREKCVNDISPDKRGIGMVFQDYALYPHMTVRKNIEFPLKMNKLKKSEIDRRVKKISSLVHIEDLLDRKPGQLSGGQQQRVAIARALVKEPEILLLDEPLSNLDARLRVELRSEIRRIQKALGITTIFVTHDQEEAVSISDYIVLMEDGELRQYDEVEKLYDDPENIFVAEFLGSPKINKFDVSVKENTVTKASYIDGFEELYPDLKDGDYIFAVRAEEIILREYNENSKGAVVKLVEKRGKDYLLHLDLDGYSVLAYIEKDNKVKVGDKLGINIDSCAGFLFEKTSGVRVKSLEK